MEDNKNNNIANSNNNNNQTKPPLDQIFDSVTLGVAPVVFGPVTWESLHLWSTLYPINPTEAEKEDAARWIEMVFARLGCPSCVLHAFQYAEQNPVQLNSRSELIRWFHDFHNAVNKKLGKPQFTDEQFIQKYFIEYAGRVGQATQAKAIAQYLHLKLTDPNNTHRRSTMMLMFLALLIFVIFILVLIRWFRSRAEEE